jgi:hypothetical protein
MLNKELINIFFVKPQSQHKLSMFQQSSLCSRLLPSTPYWPTPRSFRWWGISTAWCRVVAELVAFGAASHVTWLFGALEVRCWDISTCRISLAAPLCGRDQRSRCRDDLFLQRNVCRCRRMPWSVRSRLLLQRNAFKRGFKWTYWSRFRYMWWSIKSRRTHVVCRLAYGCNHMLQQILALGNTLLAWLQKKH